MNDELLYDKPRSQGVENAFRRVEQPMKTRWAPVKELVITDTIFLQSPRSGKSPPNQFLL